MEVQEESHCQAREPEIQFNWAKWASLKRSRNRCRTFLFLRHPPLPFVFGCLAPGWHRCEVEIACNEVVNGDELPGAIEPPRFEEGPHNPIPPCPEGPVPGGAPSCAARGVRRLIAGSAPGLCETPRGFRASQRHSLGHPCCRGMPFLLR